MTTGTAASAPARVLPRGAVRVRPSRAGGSIEAPASKSVTIRRVLVAALTDGETHLDGPLDADDTRAVRRAVAALGAPVRDDRRGWVVSSSGPPLAVPSAPIDCGLSGTTLRLVTAVACHARGPVSVTGAAPLLRRPVGPLVSALGQLGAAVRAGRGDLPPVHLDGGGLAGGMVTVDVTRSSQYASAVLLAAPAAAAPVDLRLVGGGAHAYVELTADVLRAAGAVLERTADGWRVEPGPLRVVDGPVEHDASAACHLMALAAASGGQVTVSNAGATRQPDAELTAVLAAFGARVDRQGDAVTVTGPARLAPVDVDLERTPDQITTVAALAALADGTSHIRGAGVTRGHETDRIAALAHALQRLGVPTDERPDGLVIHGGRGGALERGEVALPTHDDHRLAMAYAALGAAPRTLLRADVVVLDAGCVAKTYPGFWTDAAALGVSWEAVG